LELIHAHCGRKAQRSAPNFQTRVFLSEEGRIAAHGDPGVLLYLKHHYRIGRGSVGQPQLTTALAMINWTSFHDETMGPFNIDGRKESGS